jgi:3-hydroxybutyryl-CoA dehydrogenase
MDSQDSTGHGPPLEPESHVVVAGGGLMGAQIALEYALAGYATRMVNRSEQSAVRAQERSRDALALLVAEGLVAEELAQAGISRLTASPDLAESCRGASLVIESIVENLEAKIELLGQISALAPAAILATNTSSLSISELGRRSATARRLIGTHYWSPPTLMPLVEVIPGDETDVGIVSTVLATLRLAGKEPVVAPDIPGFIWNRLQVALLREAVGLARRHGVPAATVDLVMRKGLGRRFSVVGPFETVALGGPATFAAVMALVGPHLVQDVMPEELAAIEMPDGASMGPVRSARDRALAALLRADGDRMGASAEERRT